MADANKEELESYAYRVVDLDVDEHEVKQLYSKLSHSYDKVMETVIWTPTVANIADKIQNHVTDRNQRILDIGAGTGQLGQELKKYGFTDLDALDVNPDMLKQAQDKNIYKHITIGKVGDRLAIDDKTYDIIVGTGLFLPGHAGPDCFPEMIRILKPGGLFICNVAERWKKDTPELNPYTVDFEAKIQEHVKSGEWVLEKKEVIENYTSAGNGIQFYCRKA